MSYTPIRLALTQSIQAALQAIQGQTVTRLDGTVYTYVNTVKPTSVVLDDVNLITGFAATEVPAFVVLAPEPEEVGPWTTQGPAPRFQQKARWTVWCRVDAPAGSQPAGIADSDRKSAAFEHLLADLEVALTQDVLRGGLAAYTTVRQPVPGSGGLPNQDIVIAGVPVEIQWARPYGAP